MKTAYEHTLEAMERLLRAAGETHWATWMQQDLKEWRESGSTRHHRSAYGGMGSFNDLWLTPQDHGVSAEQEPWANELFEWLKALLFWLARDPSRHVTAAELRSAFAATARPLAGWRCLRCGFSEVTPSDIDGFIAAQRIPPMVFTACERGTLETLVDSVLAMDLEELTSLRPVVRAAAEASGIRVVARDGWMRLCPQCGSERTAVYRWILETGPDRFEPAGDNLPMASSGTRE